MNVPQMRSAGTFPRRHEQRGSPVLWNGLGPGHSCHLGVGSHLSTLFTSMSSSGPRGPEAHLTLQYRTRGQSSGSRHFLLSCKKCYSLDQSFTSRGNQPSIRLNSQREHESMPVTRQLYEDVGEGLCDPAQLHG